VGAALFALLLSILWSGNNVAIKAGLRDAPPLRLGWMRFLVGGIVVLAWALVSRADLRVRPGEWRKLLTLGVIFSVQLVFLNIGTDHTTAGNSLVMNTTYPIWVAILAHFFIPDDRLTLNRAFGVLLAYAGIVLVFLRSLAISRDLLLGDALTLTSGFLLGVRIIYTSRAVQDVDPAKLLLAQAAVGGASFLVASAIWEPEPYRWTRNLFLAVLYQGAIVAGFNFIGNMWLLKHYLPSRTSVIGLSQPLFGILLSWLILGEALSARLLVGAALVIIGVGLAQRQRKPGLARPGRKTA